jgi:hypothetical protein
MKQSKLAETLRDRLFQQAQKELAEAERREREFSKAERRERATHLHLPVSARAA